MELKDTSEKVFRDLLAKELNGQVEVTLPNQFGRIDIVTPTEIIEVKALKQWKAALGQIMIYSLAYPNHRRRIHLFGSNLERLELITKSCEIYHTRVTAHVLLANGKWHFREYGSPNFLVVVDPAAEMYGRSAAVLRTDPEHQLNPPDVKMPIDGSIDQFFQVGTDKEEGPRQRGTYFQINISLAVNAGQLDLHNTLNDLDECLRKGGIKRIEWVLGQLEKDEKNNKYTRLFLKLVDQDRIWTDVKTKYPSSQIRVINKKDMVILQAYVTREKTRVEGTIPDSIRFDLNKIKRTWKTQQKLSDDKVDINTTSLKLQNNDVTKLKDIEKRLVKVLEEMYDELKNFKVTLNLLKVENDKLRLSIRSLEHRDRIKTKQIDWLRCALEEGSNNENYPDG